jgi:hypothetical protein
VVYRRFSEFNILDKEVREALGIKEKEKAKAAKEKEKAKKKKEIEGDKEDDGSDSDDDDDTMGFPELPPFYFVPSLFDNSAQEVRRNSLDIYLNTLLLMAPTVIKRKQKEKLSKLIEDFLDIENKGRSGLAQSLPTVSANDKIVRESFGQMTGPYNLFWGNYFLALSSKNVLYVAKDIYDTISGAAVAIPLDLGNTKVEARTNLKFDVINGENHYCFCFSNQNDTAHWLRCISDACMGQTISRPTAESRREASIKQRDDNIAKKEASRQAQSTEHVYHDQIGATKDSLQDFGI